MTHVADDPTAGGAPSPVEKLRREHDAEQPGSPTPEEIEALDPDAPGASVFTDDEDAVEPNEPA